jgi:4-oxalomesaconate tautomerase
MQKPIPFMQLRGGSSKGLYFLASDLPTDNVEREKILLGAMCGVDGSDPRQIDGLGGADPLTSKVAIVNPSSRNEVDIDYEFIQVVVGKNKVDRIQNCGNILAGVAPFAIEAGIITTKSPETRVRVYMVNSDSTCEVIVQTPSGVIKYDGNTHIDGVPGRASPIGCYYMNIIGSACGELFPTGNRQDVINGIDVTCIDNGMPVVLLRASDFGRTGYESRDALNVDQELKSALEDIRLQLGPMMNLAEVKDKVVPKMCLISAPLDKGIVHTRTFIPHACHAAIGVLGAVSVATACIVPGTVAEGITVLPASGSHYSIEHPSGEFTVSLELRMDKAEPEVLKAGVIRTARLLSRGEVMIPSS